MEKVNKAGIFLVVLSTYVLALTIPISIAGDSIGVAIGGLGLLLILISKDFKNFPTLKPILFIFIGPALTMLSQFSLNFLSWSCINHHVFPYFTSYKAMKEKRILKRILYLLIISTTISSMVIIFEAFTHQSYKHIILSNIHFYLTSPAHVSGFFTHPLITSAILLIISFLLIGLWLNSKKMSGFILISVIFSFFAIVLLQERSAFLGLIGGIIFIVLFVRSKKTTFIIVLFLAAGTIIFFSPALQHRFTSIISNKYRGWSAKDRIILWKDYLITFEHYNLKEKLFGAGKKTRLIVKKNFPEAFFEITGKTKRFREIKNHFHGGISHNIYLRYLDETGIVGLLFFLIFWIYLLWTNISNAKNHPLREVLLSLAAGYIAFLVMGFFENNFVDAATNMALMFIVGLNMFLIEHRKSL